MATATTLIRLGIRDTFHGGAADVLRPDQDGRGYRCVIKVPLSACPRQAALGGAGLPGDTFGRHLWTQPMVDAAAQAVQS